MLPHSSRLPSLFLDTPERAFLASRVLPQRLEYAAFGFHCVYLGRKVSGLPEKKPLDVTLDSLQLLLTAHRPRLLSIACIPSLYRSRP